MQFPFWLVMAFLVRILICIEPNKELHWEFQASERLGALQLAFIQATGNTVEASRTTNITVPFS